MKRHLLMLAISIMILSCSQFASTPTPILREPTPSVPNELLGEFYCSGHERGMLAMAGILTLRADGSFALQWLYGGPSLEGPWHYDSASGQVMFSSDLVISHAVYNDEVDTLRVYLREGVERAHVETGVMYCERRNW